MNLRSLATRTAAAGAVSALAAGALIGVSTTAANAATVTDTYTCVMTGVYSGNFDMTVSGELPVPQYWAGAAVPAGLVNLTASATVPADAAALLGGAGVTGAKSDDYALTLGNGSVPIPISGNFASDGTTTTWQASGSNLDFVTGDPGVVDGFLPMSFTLQPTKADGTTFGSLTCTVTDAAPAEIVTDFPLLRQSSETVVTPTVIKVKKGKVAKIPATVSSTSMGGPVTGKVVAKEGTKTLAKGTLKAGKVTLKLPKTLKLGKHKVTVKYLGIPSVKGSSDKVVVKVVK